ncbi:SEC-C domain-containing protein [Paenibacillus apis]|nr:SEC-C domain-containing protein [Paenibacillus apis]
MDSFKLKLSLQVNFMILTKSRIDLFELNPYEPCPCDSGAKFKFCCYKKAKASKPKRIIDLSYSDGRIHNFVKQFWEKTDFHTCFAFNKEECDDLIKSAHSIQNNRILNRISKDGHLYTISSTGTKEGPVSYLNKISRNKASTFFGFCNIHDTELFRPIEKKEYIGESIQNFLFAFRAHAIEHHKKLRKLNSQKNIFIEFPFTMLEKEHIYVYRVAQLDVRDCSVDYKVFKKDYSNANFDNFRTLYRKLDFEVSFAACSSFAVEYDLEGNIMNDIYSVGYEHMPSIYVNVYPTSGGTNILLSYHLNNDGTYKNYFDQLEKLKNEDLLKYLNFLLIQYTENIFFDPSFIENLSEKQKNSLLKSFDSSIYPIEKAILISEGSYYKFNLFEKNMDKSDS